MRRRALPLVLLACCASWTACGGSGTPSAYHDGFAHGPDAFEARPLTRRGAPVAGRRFREACIVVANFYLVPADERPDWLRGCVDGAHAFSK